jgi:hypothetical protein
MQATRQSRAKVKRNIPPRSGDQPQPAVYSIPTRTTNREDRKIATRHCGEEAESRTRTRRSRVVFVCFAVTSPGISRRERSSGGLTTFVLSYLRLAVRGGEPLTMQRSERWAVFQVRGHNGQHGDIASPLRSIRGHGLRLTLLRHCRVAPWFI